MTIAGTGPEEAALRELARSLGLDDAVQFAGRLDPDAVAALYRSADVALNPSTVDNMPNSVLEALASGVPVVSTDVGGVPYIVQHGTTALLVPARDPSAMANAVLQLLDNPAQAEALASAGRAEVERYTWPRVSEVLDHAYRKAMAAPVP